MAPSTAVRLLSKQSTVTSIHTTKLRCYVSSSNTSETQDLSDRAGVTVYGPGQAAVVTNRAQWYRIGPLEKRQPASGVWELSKFSLLLWTSLYKTPEHHKKVGINLFLLSLLFEKCLTLKN